MARQARTSLALRAATVAAAVVASVPSAGAFSKGDLVKVVASHAGPVNNPSETYNYYVLPFCAPKGDGSVQQDMSESLTGDRKVETAYELPFATDVEFKEVCTQEYSGEELSKLATAVEEDWYFEMFADELPMWGYVGEHEAEDFLLGHTDRSKHYLYTHLHFTIGYNGDKVVTANVSASPAYRQDITGPEEEDVNLGESKGRGGAGGAGGGSSGGDKPRPDRLRVTFSYSVSWVASTVLHEDRMDVYSASNFLPQTLEIHWLSIINSLVLVMLLTAFLAIILMRVIKNDFTRYMRADEDEEVGEEETGWKLIHGDVFRVPANLSVFAAFVGAGSHLLVMTLLLLTLAVGGFFSLARRGSIVAACILLYVLCSAVGGYASARLYKQLKGTNWVWNVMLSLAVFPAPLLGTFSLLNTTAIAKSSTAALPIGTILVVLLLFVCVAFPLTVFGGIAGHNSREYEPPCRTSRVERQIPGVPWYRSAPVQMFMAGFLPFSAISIELHYIFASVWGHKVYTLYGILFLAFGLLTLVTGFIVIAITYFQLTAEDHRWWWRSFLSGGMVGVFIYAYCFFYYFNHSGMTGFLQTAFYFGYMANVAFAFFLMMGTIGFYSAWFFVRYIYSSIKTD